MESTDSFPRKDEALEYLKTHKIEELFHNMTSQLIYNEPSAPKEFLIETLEKLQKSRTTKMEYPCLFDESNINSIFGMLDPVNKGYITLQQYEEAMTTLGIQNFDQRPPGHDVNKITPDIFMKEAKMGLTRSSATYTDMKK